MNEKNFIDKLRTELEAHNTLPEVPMQVLHKILFNNAHITDQQFHKKLIDIKNDYGIDSIIVLSNTGKPPVARFWLKKQIKELPKEINVGCND